MIYKLFWPDHLERSLKIAKEEIEAYTESTLAKQKDIASEVMFQPCNSWNLKIKTNFAFNILFLFVHFHFLSFLFQLIDI